MSVNTSVMFLFSIFSENCLVMTEWKSWGLGKEIIDVIDDEEESEVLEVENVGKKEVIENVSDLTGEEHVPDTEESNVLHDRLKIAVVEYSGGRMETDSVLNTGSGNLVSSSCDIGQLQLCSDGSSSLEAGESQIGTQEVIGKLQHVDEEEYDEEKENKVYNQEYEHNDDLQEEYRQSIMIEERGQSGLDQEERFRSELYQDEKDRFGLQREERDRSRLDREEIFQSGLDQEERDNSSLDPENIEDQTNTDYYTDSYGQISIHETMLRDEIRTGTYRKAMVHNKHMFEGKIVLDVGCGTGILSMFAAEAGAAKVIGVDMSAMAEQAKNIVEENGWSDVVTIIRAKLEDIELPDGIQKVDVIVSEWMGYCLLYENMLETVIYARDKWLDDSGLMFPDLCTLYICGMEDTPGKSDRFDFWDDVYGFKMSSMKSLSMRETVVSLAQSHNVVTTPCLIKEVDLYTCGKEELVFCSPFCLDIIRKDTVQALLTYFDVFFTHCHQKVMFSTSPFTAPTHWKQTIFYLEESMTVQQGEEMVGTFWIWPNVRNNQDLEFDNCVQHKGEVKCVRERKFYR